MCNRRRSMCYQKNLIILFYLIICCCRTIYCKERHYSHYNKLSINNQFQQNTIKKNIHHGSSNGAYYSTYKNRTTVKYLDYNIYTEWSHWSHCIDCIQRRMKTCINPMICQHLRMYEERECDKKRCKRKIRKKLTFRVVRIDMSSRSLKKPSSSKLWNKWSKWIECSPECRTYRIRICRKSARCPKLIQKDTAYCYYENSECELWVLAMLEEKQKGNQNYNINFNGNQIIAREPRRKSKNCGRTFNKPQMLKIIGGMEAPKYKWPWHVAILNHFLEVFCGGTLIASRWVLTASHCLRQHLKVRLNAHDLLATDGRDIEMTVYRMFPHPRFEIQTVDNDIALLMLPRSVEIPIACLPKRLPKIGQMCSVMGWGKVHTSHSFGVSILHEAKIPVVAHDICKRSYKEFLISDNMLCAGWKSGKSDTCAGDSGGGLMCPNKRKLKNPVYSVQGITSFGDGCAVKNKYGIYTAVFNYVNWIYRTIDLYS